MQLLNLGFQVDEALDFLALRLTGDVVSQIVEAFLDNFFFESDGGREKPQRS